MPTGYRRYSLQQLPRVAVNDFAASLVLERKKLLLLLLLLLSLLTMDVAVSRILLRGTRSSSSIGRIGLWPESFLGGGRTRSSSPSSESSHPPSLTQQEQLQKVFHTFRLHKPSPFPRGWTVFSIVDVWWLAKRYNFSHEFCSITDTSNGQIA